MIREQTEHRPRPDDLLDVGQTASLLGLSESRVRELVQEKELSCFPYHGRMVFVLEDLLAWKTKNINHYTGK